MALLLFGYACNTAELLLSMYAPIFLRLSVGYSSSPVDQDCQTGSRAALRNTDQKIDLAVDSGLIRG